MATICLDTLVCKHKDCNRAALWPRHRSLCIASIFLAVCVGLEWQESGPVSFDWSARICQRKYYRADWAPPSFDWPARICQHKLYRADWAPPSFNWPARSFIGQIRLRPALTGQLGSANTSFIGQIRLHPALTGQLNPDKHNLWLAHQTAESTRFDWPSRLCHNLFEWQIRLQ